MPEYPDILVYQEALEARVSGQYLFQVRLASPFLLRTVQPPLSLSSGKRVLRLRRVGKRMSLGLEDDLWLVIHLMVAGRLHWKKPHAKLTPRRDLAAFDFETGTLTLTEGGSKRRASLHLLRGEAALQAIDPGGQDPVNIGLPAFVDLLRRENHTLKRTLTDPRLLSGIGNAYSDEILHAARLSPLAMSGRISDEEMIRLHQAMQQTLAVWADRLRTQAGAAFPEKVTAFRPEMAVHGKYGQPCPVCNSIVRRIRYADNETNYCPGCQTGGSILADRAISRLLREDWPRSEEEWERLRSPAQV